MRGLVAAGLVAAALMTGCGEDSDEGGTGETTPTATTSVADEAATSSEGTGEALSKDEYERRYQELGDESEARVAEIEESIGGADPDDFGAAGDAFHEFAGFTREVAGELDALQPPEDIAEAHQGYVDVLFATADAYDEVADGIAEAEDQAAAAAELQGLQETFQEDENLDAVIAFAKAIKRGGYDLGLQLEPGQVPGATTP